MKASFIVKKENQNTTHPHWQAGLATGSLGVNLHIVETLSSFY